MTLFGGIQSVDQHLNCDFKLIGFSNAPRQYYTCEVTSFSNPNNNVNINGYSGNHMANSNDNGVEAILIHDFNARFIPSNLGSLSTLLAFAMQSSQLTVISADHLLGMNRLEVIDFRNNYLSTVPSDVFSGLPNLRTVFLNSNQIVTLPSGLFANNPRLFYINFQNNNIKHIAPTMFDGLPILNSVIAISNACLWQEYTGSSAISQLKHDIISYCPMSEPIRVLHLYTDSCLFD